MNKEIRFLAILLLGLFFGEIGSARVFSFKNQTFSGYLHGTFGLSSVQKSAVEPGVPTTVTFPNFTGATQEYSGEFGFGFTRSLYTFRLGVELLSAQGITGQSGTNTAGTQLLSVDSQLYSVIPQANLEIFVRKAENWRVFIGGGAGYAITTLKNTFTMTQAGRSTLGVSDYIEEGSGWGIMGQGFTGIEWSFFDNVSGVFDLGYRYLMVNNFKSNRDSTTALGQLNTGNQIRNNDGSYRTVNLSGPWAGIALRIYFK